MEDRVDEKTIKRFYDTAVQAGRLAADNYDKSLLLNRLGLVNEGFLNHAGNALFGETKPITLKAGIFATSEKLTILDIKMFEDNIFNLLSFSETYILKNINWRAEIIGSTRREIPEIPVEVIREILANSFAHSVYNSSTYHEICIHPDKVTVYSPGIFASPYKPEDYIDKNLQSSIRNPKIAKVLYMNKSIEQFGSGFKRIDSLCKDSNLNYSYESTELGFTFIVYRPNVMTHERIDESIITDDELLNDVEEAVYNLLKKDNKLTRDDLAHATSKTVRTIQRALDSLKKKKLIKRVGSNKSGY